MKTKNWSFPFTPALGEDFDYESITKQYDWIEELKNCPQDPIHHAEGNVHIHTRMVLEELTKLQGWKDLEEEDRHVLFLAALMHDIAKPMCTEEKNGRISSPRHAKKGAQMARRLLYRGLPEAPPFHLREKVVQLVRHHGLPLWFWDKPDPEKTLIRVSQHLDLSKVALLAEADVLGRICDDQQELLDRVTYFREYAKEVKCYTAPYTFTSQLGRYDYFRKEEASPLYEPFDTTSFEVILMAGLPGAGKDTWVRKNGDDLPVISLDEIRRAHKISPKANQGEVVRIAKEQARIYLRKKQGFIWNATNLTAQLRKTLIDLFTTYKARVKIVYVEVDYATLFSRNRTREYPVPPKVIERFINKLEIPQVHEAHEVVWVC